MSPNLMTGMVMLCASLCFGQGGEADSPSGPASKVQVPAPPVDASRLTSETIQQAFGKAKKDGPNELMAFASSIEKRADIRTRTDLRPDFEALLADKQPEAQYLGARGLSALKDPQSKQALFSFLKGKEKDLRATKEMRRLRTAEPGISAWEMRASAYAVKALGEVGDQSVIPLLESLQGIGVIQVESGGWPVEEALVKLGSLRSLTRLRNGDDPAKVTPAACAMNTIKDPNRVPDLIAVVKDPNVAEDIRLGALSALGAIRAADAFEFLVKTLDDPNMPKRMRCVAALTMGRSSHSSAEAQLRRHAEDRSSDIRADAFTGLMALRPTVYLDQWFRIVLDVNEDPEFRSKVAGNDSAIPRQLLKDRKKELYACLAAAHSDGRPFDKIRGDIWVLINGLFWEEPPVVLSERSGGAARRMRAKVEWRVRRQDYRLDMGAVQKEVNKAMDELITVQ